MAKGDVEKKPTVADKGKEKAPQTDEANGADKKAEPRRDKDGNIIKDGHDRGEGMFQATQTLVFDTSSVMTLGCRGVVGGGSGYEERIGHACPKTTGSFHHIHDHYHTC